MNNIMMRQKEPNVTNKPDSMKRIHLHNPAVSALIMIALLICNCTDEKVYHAQQDDDARSVKVAVIMNSNEQARWERTSEWALSNIRYAQRGGTGKVQLELSFKNQDDPDIEQYMRTIAEDPEIAAIVGPTTSAHAEQMAKAISRTKEKKPMITPCATQVEYQRIFADAPYIWNLSESDIYRIEVLVSCVASTHYNDSVPIVLLTQDDDNDISRNAYAEWFGFIAHEYGISVKGVYLYRNETELRSYVREICGTDPSYARMALLFNPSSTSMAVAMDDEIGKLKAAVKEGEILFTPQIYSSDKFVSDSIAVNVRNAIYEGVDLYSSPESGFRHAYRQQFGQEFIEGEPQLYDALCIVAYASVLSGQTGQQLNDAIRSVIDGRATGGGSWLPDDMSSNFSLLAQGVTPDIDGVSGSWTFSNSYKKCNTVIGSTFRRWRLYEGQYITVEYISTDGNQRTTSAKDIGTFKADRMQNFNENDTTATYPALKDRWALLIAASSGWANYRFQADVFATYKMLRHQGYDDDHIILICQDDLADNKENIYPGQLFITPDSPNVYEHDAIDYILSDLTPADLGDILQGRASERLPHVINATPNDNIFIFWSGHGNVGSLCFGDSQKMKYAQMRDILLQTPHRKIMFAIESCYSGGLGQTSQGVPGALFITAATPWEASHADMWSEEIGVYLSNGFTRGFQAAIAHDPDISIRDLYYTVATNTTGSHVTVYNASVYGNVYNNTMGEFFGRVGK